MNNLTLNDFIKVTKASLPSKICDDIIEAENNFVWNKHQWYDKETDTSESLNYDKELDVSFINKEFSILLMDYIKLSFESYYNIFTEKCKNNGLFVNMITNCCSPRLNRYNTSTLMSLHFDHIHSLFDGTQKGVPILSLIGILNDDYKGGELVFFDNYQLDLKKGDIVVFPSCFLFPHQVNEIKEGTRYSFVSWAW